MSAIALSSYFSHFLTIHARGLLCISLSGSIALGTIGFSYLKGYRGNLLSILFGDILAVSNTDLILLLLLLAVTLA